MPATDDRPTMTLFGFPVHVRAGFVVFMLLIVLVNGGDLASGWRAASPCSHCCTNSATPSPHGGAGADASISLDFLAGYASYARRDRSHGGTRGDRARRPGHADRDELSGPRRHGCQPLVRAEVEQSVATIAIWWNGPVLGVLNLMPIMPLDGGNIAAARLDKLAPGRGEGG